MYHKYIYITLDYFIIMPHIHDKIDFTVEVFIVYKDKVLLRLHDKYHKWLGVGGHIELDEDPVQAALREVREEVGLDVTLYSEKPINEAPEFRELINPQFMNRHRINDTHEHVTFVYFAEADTDKLILSETEKSAGCRWFTKEELDDSQYSIIEDIKRYAQAALEKLACK